MATHRECNLNSLLSAMAAAALLAVTGAGSTAVLAQTATLQPPTSGLKIAPRSALAVGSTPATTLAAPAAAPMGHTGIAPVNGMANVRVGASSAVAKAYVLKAHVVPGAAFSAAQKLTTAMAAMDELAGQAKEQKDKETEQVVSMLQKNLTVANGATLSLASPKSSWGNAVLFLLGVGQVDFENGLASIVPTQATLTSGFPGASCKFVAPEDGYYMVAASIESSKNSTKPLALEVRLDPTVISKGQSTAVPLGGGANTVVAVGKFDKGHQVHALVSGDSTFNFRACEISRIK